MSDRTSGITNHLDAWGSPSSPYQPDILTPAMPATAALLLRLPDPFLQFQLSGIPPLGLNSDCLVQTFRFGKEFFARWQATLLPNYLNYKFYLISVKIYVINKQQYLHRVLTCFLFNLILPFRFDLEIYMEEAESMPQHSPLLMPLRQPDN